MTNWTGSDLKLAQELEEIKGAISELLATGEKGKLLREGVNVVIAESPMSESPPCSMRSGRQRLVLLKFLVRPETSSKNTSIWMVSRFV